MGKRRIQLKTKPQFYCIEINDNITEHDEIFNEAMNQLAEDFKKNNNKIEHAFFNSLIPICSECGMSLITKEELEDFRCLQCQAEHDKK